MALPSFLVIGAQKAGTNSLWRYLGAHPQVCMAAKKELSFFVEERTWSRGLRWYEDQFADSGDARARGEASPLYTMYPLFAGVPARIAATIPDVRMVYLVRDPFERLRSHYRHLIAEGDDQRPLSAVLRDNPLPVTFSLYALQLEQYLDHFPPDQLLVVPSELLRDERTDTMVRILEFVGADPDLLPAVVESEFHRSEEKRVMGGLAGAARRLGPARAAARLLPDHVRRWASQATSRSVASFDASIPPALERELVTRFAAQLPLVQELVHRTWPGWPGWGWAGSTVAAGPTK